MKKLLITLLVMAVLFALAACGTVQEVIQDALAAPEAADTVGTGAPITIYSNSFTDERLIWLNEAAEFAGFNIQTVGEGGGALTERLIAEAGSPIADVVFGLNAFLWHNLIANDVVIPYAPTWAREIPEGLNHPAGYYHALVIQAIMLVYDQNQVPLGPTDWLELWTDSRFHGQYMFELVLTGGTTQMVLAGILYRFRDPDGHLGISSEGWEHIAMYYRYGVPNTTGEGLFTQMANQGSPVLMGQMFHSVVPTQERLHGVNAGFPVPAVGIPFVVEGIALVNGSAQQEEAQRFIDWFGSAEVQADWQSRFDSLPANPNAHEDVSRFGEMINGLPQQRMDWAFVAENMGAWIAHISENYLP
ncbi:MAG: extracellular solute-binding protein [Defluviitaleaceae bacterium]|nr:extracellular solute-binding protein [Defluviitaleaceae bacterium]